MTILSPAKPRTFTAVPTRILQRKCACGNHSIAGGECAECSKKKGKLQRKLTVGASNDPLELEADRVAEQVMTTRAHSGQSPAPLRIQRYAEHPTESVDMAPPSVDRVLAGSGRPLNPALEQDMGERFGHDFSQVRVHTGEAAEQSARDVNARAYTAGNNIVFGTGHFAPTTHQGQRLIAHELTHVVHQSRSPVADSGPISPQHLQREETTPEDTEARDESLGFGESIVIDGLSAGAAVGNPILQPLIKGGVTGFYTEVRHQVRKGKGQQFLDRFKKLLVSPSDMLAYGKGYLWGILQGLWSPIQGIIDIVVLGWKLQQWQMETMMNVIQNFHEIAAMKGSLTDRFAKLGEKAKGLIQGAKGNAVDFISRIMGAISGGVVELAKAGGRKAGNAIFKFLEKPWGEIGEGIGIVVGTVSVEVLLAVFSGGIGNAVTKVAQTLDKVAPTLMKGVRFIASELGTIIKEIHAVVETIKAGLAKAGRSLLKGFEDFIGEAGSVFDDLIAMLKKLFSGAEDAAAKLPLDVPSAPKVPHVSAPHPAPPVKAPHIESAPGKKPPLESQAPKEPKLEAGTPQKPQVEPTAPKDPALTKKPADAVAHVNENPSAIKGEPGHRRAPAGEGHEIVEISDPSLPSGIGCELQSPPPHPKIPCPKGMGDASGITKRREPFADDPDFHKSFGEHQDVGGTNPKSLESLQEGGTAIEERGAQGAGMFNIDKHHVFPQESRPWFERRGMKGANDIDNFTVKLEKAIHQAEHGGGDWKLARKEWKEEFNQLVMRELKEAEAAKRITLGKKKALLTPDEIKETVFGVLDKRQIPHEPHDFVKYRK